MYSHCSYNHHTFPLMLETVHVYVRDRESDRDWKRDITCSWRAARKMQAQAMAVGWNRRNTSVLKLSFMKFLPNKRSGKHAIKQIAQDPLKHFFHIHLWAQKRFAFETEKLCDIAWEKQLMLQMQFYMKPKNIPTKIFYILIKSNTSDKGRISLRKIKSN